MRGARFEILHDRSTHEHLVIRDVGPWDAHRSVTNDAENVVRRLYEQRFLADGRRLLYYDSDGSLDEILHESGRFIGFAFVHSDPFARPS